MHWNRVISILIIDDEQSVRISLSEYLKDLGYDVTSVVTAEDAIAHLRTQKPDLMIVDIRLPGIDGIKLIIKAHEIYSDIKYLIHTGSVAFRLPDALIKLGLTSESVVKKPVNDLNIFNHKIQELLKIQNG